VKIRKGLQIKIWAVPEQYIQESPASCDLLFGPDCIWKAVSPGLQFYRRILQRCHQGAAQGGLLVINQCQLGNTRQPLRGAYAGAICGSDYLQGAVEGGQFLLFIPASVSCFCRNWRFASVGG